MKPDTVILSAWSVFRHSTGYRLVGYDIAEGCGRISSPLVSAYAPGRMATTESGRRYLLQGARGLNREGMETVGLWRSRFGVADGQMAEVDLEDAAAELDVRGSGNVFRDLSLPDASVLLAKADAAIAITRIIRERGMSLDEAADAAGLEPSVLRGIVEKLRVDGISLERLDRVYEAIEAHGNGRKP